MKKTNIISDVEIKLNGIEALNKSLGHTSVLRFLSLLHHESSDYVKISHRSGQGQTVNEIFERAKKSWRER